jgi:hypothetical protein
MKYKAEITIKLDMKNVTGNFIEGSGCSTDLEVLMKDEKFQKALLDYIKSDIADRVENQWFEDGLSEDVSDELLAYIL